MKVLLFGGLASEAGGSQAWVEGCTVGQVLEKLCQRYGEWFQDRLLDSEGRPRRFVKIYVNGRDIRFMGGLESPLSPGDEVSLIPAVSGGY